jgi:hypothetical protein
MIGRKATPPKVFISPENNNTINEELKNKLLMAPTIKFKYPIHNTADFSLDSSDNDDDDLNEDFFIDAHTDPAIVAFHNTFYETHTSNSGFKLMNGASQIILKNPVSKASSSSISALNENKLLMKDLTMMSKKINSSADVYYENSYSDSSDDDYIYHHSLYVKIHGNANEEEEENQEYSNTN